MMMWTSMFVKFIILCLAVVGQVLGQWPCPDAEDIAPCICHENPDTTRLSLNCSQVQDSDQLKIVFQADFPFKNMLKFQMLNSSKHLSTLEDLPAGVFGPVTFEEIYIHFSQLATIEPNVFDSMNETLRILDISHTQIVKFPFDHFDKFTNIKRLILNKNHLDTMADLVSKTLDYIDVSNNKGLYFSIEAFHQAPHLKVIKLSNVGLENLTPDIFSAQNHVNVLDLGTNSLKILKTDSFHFEAESAKTIILKNNQIVTVEKEAFTGLNPSFVINLENNHITDLDSEVWMDVFDIAVMGPSLEQINLKDNPLVCACNIKWLILNDDYMAELDDETKCNDGKLVSAVDKNVIIANCP